LFENWSEFFARFTPVGITIKDNRCGSFFHECLEDINCCNFNNIGTLRAVVQVKARIGSGEFKIVSSCKTCKSISVELRRKNISLGKS